MAEFRKRFERRRDDCRQRGDGRRRAVSGRARRGRHQGRNRPGRRLHHAHDDELRRAADSGAGRVPARPSASSDVSIIADGGIRRHGGMVEALLFGGDCTMLGSAFAGTEEAPGEIVHKSVLLPGVAEDREGARSRCCAAWPRSKRSAIGSTSRTPTGSSSRRSVPRGWRSACPARGSARTILRDMIKHLCSSISYGGAVEPGRAARRGSGPTRTAYLIKQSSSARRESYER